MKQTIVLIGIFLCQFKGFSQVENSIAGEDSTMIVDSLLLEDAKAFNDDTKKINNSLSSVGQKTQVKVDSTKPYGFYFVKKFIMEEGKVYHYAIFDSQYHDGILHLPKSKKHRDIVYKDELLKLEVDGPMKLYSMILSEKVIGSLVTFDRVYYTLYNDIFLRVEIHGAGHHYFKVFEKMYYGDSKGRLNGKRFKTVSEIVEFFNENLPKK